MKKILYIIAAVLVALPFVAMAQATSQISPPPATAPPPSLIVPWRTAIENALVEIPGVVRDFSIEEDDGQAYYELEIVQESGNEFDVKIDMLSGAVVRKENEGIASRHAEYLSAAIPYAEAVETALASLPGARLYDFELDRDRDALRYNIAIIDENGVENDIWVDAATGTISSTLPQYELSELPEHRISLAEAEAIALEDLPGGEILYIQIDRDDGAWHYEAHVVSADGYYGELEIDAESGEIHEEDWDD